METASSKSSQRPKGHLAVSDEDHHWVPTVLLVGTSAGLFAVDPYGARYFHTTTSLQGFNGIFTGKATGLASTIAPVSLYAAGLLCKDTKMQHTALLAGEALLDAEIVPTVLKDIGGRVRQVTFAPHGNYWDSWRDSQES